jgi:hypothetical protein
MTGLVSAGAWPLLPPVSARSVMTCRPATLAAPYPRLRPSHWRVPRRLHDPSRHPVTINGCGPHLGNDGLFVSFALQDKAHHDDVAGAGNGFVDVFSTSGTLLRRFASGGSLNSPWGMALAPAGFGAFSNDLLVGDFGDGRINAFAPVSGTFLGQLLDQTGHPITINGLWGLAFGNGALAGDTTTLFFAAGLNDEADGLFGTIQPA